MVTQLSAPDSIAHQRHDQHVRQVVRRRPATWIEPVTKCILETQGLWILHLMPLKKIGGNACARRLTISFLTLWLLTSFHAIALIVVRDV